MPIYLINVKSFLVQLLKLMKMPSKTKKLFFDNPMIIIILISLNISHKQL